MMPSQPQLTREQKEQFKLAHRASMRINETWSLYCMFLSHDVNPEQALKNAHEAVEVWATWMDEYDRIEPPEIEPPPAIDFVEAVKAASREMIGELKDLKHKEPVRSQARRRQRNEPFAIGYRCLKCNYDRDFADLKPLGQKDMEAGLCPSCGEQALSIVFDDPVRVTEEVRVAEPKEHSEGSGI
jgi:hypothetical protein